MYKYVELNVSEFSTDADRSPTSIALSIAINSRLINDVINADSIYFDSRFIYPKLTLSSAYFSGDSRTQRYSYTFSASTLLDMQDYIYTHIQTGEPLNYTDTRYFRNNQYSTLRLYQQRIDGRDIYCLEVFSTYSGKKTTYFTRQRLRLFLRSIELLLSNYTRITSLIFSMICTNKMQLVINGNGGSNGFGTGDIATIEANAELLEEQLQSSKLTSEDLSIIQKEPTINLEDIIRVNGNNNSSNNSTQNGRGLNSSQKNSPITSSNLMFFTTIFLKGNLLKPSEFIDKLLSKQDQKSFVQAYKKLFEKFFTTAESCGLNLDFMDQFELEQMIDYYSKKFADIVSEFESTDTLDLKKISQLKSYSSRIPIKPDSSWYGVALEIIYTTSLFRELLRDYYLILLANPNGLKQRLDLLKYSSFEKYQKVKVLLRCFIFYRYFLEFLVYSVDCSNLAQLKSDIIRFSGYLHQAGVLQPVLIQYSDLIQNPSDIFTSISKQLDYLLQSLSKNKETSCKIDLVEDDTPVNNAGQITVGLSANSEFSNSVGLNFSFSEFDYQLLDPALKTLDEIAKLNKTIQNSV